jgi:hypothetical protein
MTHDGSPYPCPSLQVVAITKLKLTTLNVDGAVKENLITAAKSLFTNSSIIWLLHLTLFYLGQIPNLNVIIPHNHCLNKITLMRLKAHIASDWHMSSVRLAS